MTLEQFLTTLKSAPEKITFNDTISLIEELYDFTETAFQNGNLKNEAGQNNGSCKIFAFAILQELPEELALHCFGDYYRKDVLENPEGTDHQNIRNFMKSGWEEIDFEGEPLSLK